MGVRQMPQLQKYPARQIQTLIFSHTSKIIFKITIFIEFFFSNGLVSQTQNSKIHLLFFHFKPHSSPLFIIFFWPPFFCITLLEFSSMDHIRKKEKTEKKDCAQFYLYFCVVLFPWFTTLIFLYLNLGGHL